MKIINETNQKYGNVLNIKLIPNLSYKSQSLLKSPERIKEKVKAPMTRETPTADQKRNFLILKIFFEMGFSPSPLILCNAIWLIFLFSIFNLIKFLRHYLTNNFSYSSLKSFLPRRIRFPMVLTGFFKMSAIST